MQEILLPYQRPNMPAPDQKLESYKLETVFRESYVVHTTYQWVYSERVGVESTWKQDRVIGDGATGEVWLEREEKGSLRAVKKLDQRSEAKAHFTQELLVMAKLKDYTHLFLELFGWYENRDHIFLAMEYIERGSLGEYIKNNQKPTELEVKEITRQILEGLEVLHGKNICHRDLKPENVLVASTQPIWVKVADFGISKRAKNTQLQTFCGTDGYFAPELLGFFQQKGAKKRSGNLPHTGEAFTYVLDIWSLGCLVHRILTSHTPFSSTDNGDEPTSQDVGLIGSVIDMRSLRKYCKGTIDLPVEPLQRSQVSEEGIGFVKSLLVADPKDRPTATCALQSPWLKGYKNTWLEDLKNEFSSLGVDLDFKGKENIHLRQVGKADIMQFLPALNGGVLSLLLRAIEKECCLAVLKILESPSCDLNRVDSLTRGKLLKIAARAGQLDKVKLLLYDKADIDTENNHRIALIAAAGAGHIDIIKFLLDCTTDVDTSSDEETALIAAVNGGHIETASLLLDRGADANTALLAAITGGYIGVITLLFDRGADANTALQAAVKSMDIEDITLLLDNGADANTALLAAVKGRNIEVITLLLDHGADANTALLAAIIGGYTEVVTRLLDRGTDPNIVLLAAITATLQGFL